MKHNFKKILSIFLVALMCLSTLPMGAFAEEIAAEMPVCPTCKVNTNVVESSRAPQSEATCFIAAGEWYKCTTIHADNTPQEFIKPYGGSVAHHDPESGHVTHQDAVGATCMANGSLEYYTCDVCNVYYKTADMSPTGAKYEKFEDTVVPKLPYDDESSHKFVAEPTDWTVWEDWKDDIAPECGEHDGIALFGCTVDGCTYVKEVLVEADEHEWAYESHVEVADCLTDTIVTEKCTLCGDTRDVPGKGWNHIVIKTEAVAKDCENAGNEAYYTCKVCGDYFMDADENEDGAVWLTCEAEMPNGLLSRTTVCVVAVEEGAWVVPASHEPVEMTGAPATCLTAGAETYYDCSECDKYFADEACTEEIAKDSWILSATGHNVIKVVAVASGCVTDGNYEYYDCSGCDLYFMAAEEGDTAYDDAAVMLNGAALGFDVKTVALTDTVDPADGHDFGEVVEANNAPCTAQYEAYKVCAVCEGKFAPDATKDEENTLDPIAKVWVPNPKFDPLSNPTDSENDKGIGENPQWVLAGTDGALDIDEQHKWTWEIAKLPTCELGGSIVWSCELCNAYTGLDESGNAKHIIYNIAPTYHSAIDTTVNGWYTPASATDCRTAGLCAYAQCPACSKYLVVAFDQTGVAYVANPETGAYDTLVTSVFGTAKDSSKHVGFQFSVSGDAANCFETTIKAYKVCMACYMAYIPVNGEMTNPVQLPFGTLSNPAYLTDAYYNFACEEGTYHAAVDADDVACGESYGVAYYECSCGKLYGVVEGADGELTVDKTVTYKAAPLTVKQHDYQEVAATFNCLNDGELAHYVCGNDGCDKKFLYIKVAGIIDQYVEVTADDLAQEATGKHNFETVTKAVQCAEGVAGVAGLEECTVCGFERAIDPHIYTDMDYLTIDGTNEATCTEVGHYALKCHFCQTYQRTEDGSAVKIYEAPKKAHTDYGKPTFVQYKASTCFEAGNLAYYQCNGCSLKFPTADMKNADVFETTVIAPDTNVEVEDGKVNVSLGSTITETYKAGWEVIPVKHGQINGISPVDEAVVECGLVKIAQYQCKDCGYYSVKGYACAANAPDAEKATWNDWQADYYTKDDAAAHSGALKPNNDAVDVSCMNDGHLPTATCQGDCGRKYIINDDGSYTLVVNNSDVIPMLPHNGTFMPATPPTCTTQGWKAWFQVCTNGCNKIYGATDDLATDPATAVVDTTKVYDIWNLQMIIPVRGHAQTAENTVGAVESVCTGINSIRDGNIAYYVCDRCDKMFADGDTGIDAVELDQYTIRPVPHEPIDTLDKNNVVAATCTEVGYAAYECVCGFRHYEFYAPKNHRVIDFNEEKVEATCSKEGLEEYYFCANCKTSYKDADLTQVWKAYTNVVLADAKAAAAADAVIPATNKHVNIDANGNKTEIIPGCYNGEFVEQPDGTWVEEGVDYRCDECDKDFIKDHTWVSGHVAANCTYAESDYDVCEICHVINENTRVILSSKNPNVHSDPLTQIVNPDKDVYCTDTAKAYDQCVFCKQQIGDTYALKHNIVENKEARDEGTCKEDGTSYWYCTKCNYNYTETIEKPDDHKWVDNWTDVAGMENNYTSEKAEVRYCDYGCGEAQYRAHQDVNFTATVDSDIKAGAELVNSGKLAVTIKMNAFKKKANYFTVSFEYSDNLIYDSVVFSDAAKAFGQCDGGVKVVNNANVCTLNTFRFQASDFDINGENIVYATIYFTIADDAQGTKAEIKNLKVVDIATVEGDPVDYTVGKDVSKDIYMLGDMNGDGDITAADMRLIANLASAGSYDARADVDKSGSLKPIDVTATQKFVVGTFTYDQLIHPENR